MNRSGGQSVAIARRDGESGYALLLVFLMAAILAISLYSELPRVAFQSQRHQEQLLMERGMQYMRAIQVYQQVNKGWPRSVDDIETFQTRHFLRHKYIDPMTGKDEWRLIHTSGVALTDSLVTQNPATTQQSTSSQSSYISAYAGIGETLTGDQSQRQAGPARRPSEGGGGDLPPMMGGSSDQSGQLPLPGSTPDNPTNSAANTPNQGATGGQSGVPGMPGMPASMPPGQTTAGIGGQMPGGAPGQNVPGMPGLPGGAGNPALSMINNILTNPNPQAAQMAAQGGALGGTPATLGGGLAGVASKSEYEGIMVYNTQTLYKKWEFVFDPTKVAPIGGVSGTPGTPVSQMGSQTAQQGLASAFGGGNQQGQPGGGGASAPGGIGMPGGAGMSGGTGMSMSSAFASSTSTSPGATGNNVATGGNPNSPAGMQTGAAGSGALPPGFRMGRP